MAGDLGNNLKSLSYDSKADAAYAYGHGEKVSRTVEVNDNVFMDVSSKGHIVGIEILNAKTFLSKVLGIQLNADELEKIQYEVDEQPGICLHLRFGQKQASVVLPSRPLRA